MMGTVLVWYCDHCSVEKRESKRPAHWQVLYIRFKTTPDEHVYQHSGEFDELLCEACWRQFKPILNDLVMGKLPAKEAKSE